MSVMCRSQPDLSRLVREEEEEGEQEVAEELEEEMVVEQEEEEDETPSLLHTRGKSGLISVWENRIQSEKLA